MRRSKQILHIGQALFGTLLLLTMEAGLPPPVHAATRTKRVEPVALYASELLILAPAVLPKLDALQCEGVLAGSAGSAFEDPVLLPC